MEDVLGLMLMLLGVSHGVGTYCDGRQDGAQCYGTLGGTVVLLLMDNVSEIPRFHWIKESQMILIWRSNKIILNQMENRFLFIPSNGAFEINDLSRNDSGEYKLEMFDSQGKLTGTRTLQLTVQAPVSSVQLVSECLSEGEMKVSCSSEGGDSPQYSWTLDGHTLTDSQLLSGNNETNIITLKQNVSGRLVCSVRNHISSVSKQMMMSVGRDEGTACDGRRDGAQCYGVLGGTAVLRLMDNASEIPRYDWKKETFVILKGRNNQIVSNTLESRYFFIPSSGTFRINNLNRDDGGKYTLVMFDSQGKLTGTRTLQLTVQAPVSSVQLVSECLFEGYIWASCSSEGGDSPQYSWTLDGHTLTDSERLSGNIEANIITLKQDVSGRLVCSVRNHISSASKQMMISACRDLSLLVCGLLALVAIISFVGIGVFFKWKQTKSKKAEKSTAAHRAENSEDLLVIEMRNRSDH